MVANSHFSAPKMWKIIAWESSVDCFAAIPAILPFCHSGHSAICPSIRYSTIPPFRNSAIPPFCHSAIPPFRHSAIPPFRHSAVPRAKPDLTTERIHVLR
jgi:hypothetical protein